MTDVDRSVRLQVDHPLVETSGAGSLEEHCLQLMHLRAYEEITETVRDKVVLDLGCNVGYGTKLISRVATRTVGVDVAARSINLARSRYAQDQIEFRVFDGLQLPFEDACFDVVTTFQVIEHVTHVEQFLTEIRRVLRAGGVAVFTTPNAAIRLDPGLKPWNRFHVREYRAAELEELLARHFSHVTMLGLFASAELYAVEFNRCQRARMIARWRGGHRSRLNSWSSVQAAAIGTVLRVLPERVTAGMVSLLRAIARSARRRPSTYSQYSTDHLCYRAAGLDESLDLLAICRKPGAGEVTEIKP